MRKLLETWLTVLCLLLMLVVEPEAQIDWKKVGPGPVGMGTAVLSTSTREYSVIWNPAGLAGLENTYLHLSYANFCKIDLSSYYASFITPLRFLGVAIGIDWLGKRDSTNKLDFDYNQLHFAFGRSLSDRLKLGASLNLTGGVKLGVVYDLDFGLNFAGTVYNDNFIPNQIVTHENYHYTQISSAIDSIPKKEKQWSSRFGLSCRLYKPILSIDYEAGEKNLYAGTEVWFYPKSSLAIALRAGTRFDLDKNKFVTATAGLALKFDISKRANMNLDFAYVGSSREEESGQGGATLEIEGALTWTITPCACPYKIDLSWLSGFTEEEQGFYIQKSPDGDEATFATIATLNGENEGTYSDWNVEPGKKYYYRIIIFGSSGIIMSWVFDVTTPGVSWGSYLKIFKSSSLDTIRLAFGQASDATDGLNSKYCEKNDPLPGSGLAARFKFPGSAINSLFDFRKISDYSQWTINLQYQTSNLPLTLVWNKEKLKTAGTLQNVNIILRDKKMSIDTDMKNIKEYTISSIGYSIGDLMIVIELPPVI